MDSERSDFLVYLQQDNARLRSEVEELRGELGTRVLPPTPKENHPPEQMTPVGRKVYTTSQLKQKARETLLANYRKGIANA